MTHLLLSQGEVNYQKSAVDSDIRSDGRSCFDYRDYHLDTGVISLAHGSARLRLDTCDILAAIKLELGTPDVSQPSHGKVFFSVDCSASASQEFEGRGADEFNGELSEFLEQFIGRTIDKKRLIISEGEQCWIMYVDVLVLDYGGNLGDAMVMAVRSALSNTKIPKVEFVKKTQEIIISEDLEEAESFDVSKLPLCLTLCKLGEKYVIDPQWQEELCADIIICVGITRDGQISGLTKRGTGIFSNLVLKQMLCKVSEISRDLHQRHDRLTREANSRSFNHNNSVGHTTTTTANNNNPGTNSFLS